MAFTRPIYLDAAAILGPVDDADSVLGAGDTLPINNIIAAYLAGLTAATGAKGTQTLGWDGSPQAAIGTVPNAVEYPRLLGGIAGIGPTIYADSDVSANVDLTASMKGQGSLTVGNALGRLLVAYSTASAVPAWAIVANALSPGGHNLVLIGGAGRYTSTVADLILRTVGNGALIAGQAPDGTATGGNDRGANAVDLQTNRSAATQVAAGAGSFQAGIFNTTSGQSSGNIGSSNTVDGNFSFATGRNARTFTRYGFVAHSTGFNASPGDNLTGNTNFFGRSVGGVAVRLLADGATVAQPYVLAQNPNGGSSLNLLLHGQRVGTGEGALWSCRALLQKGATAGTTVLTLGTPETLGTALTVAVTADTTNSGLNITAKPAGTTDTWDFTLRIDLAEGQ